MPGSCLLFLLFISFACYSPLLGHASRMISLLGELHSWMRMPSLSQVIFVTSRSQRKFLFSEYISLLNNVLPFSISHQWNNFLPNKFSRGRRLRESFTKIINSALQCRLECQPGYATHWTPLITCVHGKYEKRASLYWEFPQVFNFSSILYPIE